jgi:hypothetical protein
MFSQKVRTKKKIGTVIYFSQYWIVVTMIEYGSQTDKTHAVTDEAA